MRAVASRHSVGSHAHDGCLDDVFAVQQNNPVDRPHELGLAIAPAHAPRNRQALQCVLDQRGHEFGRFLTSFALAENQVHAFYGFFPIEGLDVNAALFRESAAGGGDVALVVVGDRHRRPLDDPFLAGL